MIHFTIVPMMKIANKSMEQPKLSCGGRYDCSNASFIAHMGSRAIRYDLRINIFQPRNTVTELTAQQQSERKSNYFAQQKQDITYYIEYAYNTELDQSAQ
jgi:hypothetical protein